MKLWMMTIAAIVVGIAAISLSWYSHWFIGTLLGLVCMEVGIRARKRVTDGLRESVIRDLNRMR